MPPTRVEKCESAGGGSSRSSIQDRVCQFVPAVKRCNGCPGWQAWHVAPPRAAHSCWLDTAQRMAGASCPLRQRCESLSQQARTACRLQDRESASERAAAAAAEENECVRWFCNNKFILHATCRILKVRASRQQQQQQQQQTRLGL
jgi:hypothetical protein